VAGDGAISAMQKVLEGWPQLTTLVSIIKSDPTLSAIVLADRSGKMEERETWPVAVSMTQFLRDYVETVNRQTPIWQEEAFDRLFNIFAESIRLGGYRMILWTALYNCYRSEIPVPIEISPSVSIAEPDENTHEVLLPTFTLDNPPFGAARLYIRAEGRVPFHSYPSSNTQRASSHVVIGVRLAVGGNAYIRQTRAIAEAGSCMTTDAFGSYRVGQQPFGGVFHADNPSWIGGDDVEAIRRLTAAVPKLNDEFPIAVSRFTSTTERQSPTDRLIDASIGLENLFLQGTNDELSFRLALRAAWLLGQSANERREIFGELKKVYDSRSRVVHGGVQAPAEPAIVDAAVDSLRRVLRKIAELNVNPKQLADRLNAVVFGETPL
jgi:Apea-like HEPN